MLGSISPLIRFPIEKTTGYQWFRGKPTSEVIDASNFATAPKAFKEFIKYTSFEVTKKDGTKYTQSVALDPEAMMTLNNLPFVGRTMKMLSDITDKDVDGGLKTLQTLTGVRTENLDFEREKQKQEEKILKDLQEVLKNAGVMGEFTRYYTRKNTQRVE